MRAREGCLGGRGHGRERRLQEVDRDAKGEIRGHEDAKRVARLQAVRGERPEKEREDEEKSDLVERGRVPRHAVAEVPAPGEPGRRAERLVTETREEAADAPENEAGEDREA